MQTSKTTPRTAETPLDRLIRLLAEIEVSRYMEELIEKEQSENNAEDEGGDLRTL